MGSCYYDFTLFCVARGAGTHILVVSLAVPILVLSGIICGHLCCALRCRRRRGGDRRRGEDGDEDLAESGCSPFSASNFDLRKVNCYLCGKRVRAVKFKEHRIACCRDNWIALDSLLLSQISCQQCGNRRMRLWPKCVLSFTCSSPDCPKAGRSLVDADRYNCFPCDFDLCSVCARRLERQASNNDDNAESIDGGNATTPAGGPTATAAARPSTNPATPPPCYRSPPPTPPPTANAVINETTFSYVPSEESIRAAVLTSPPPTYEESVEVVHV